MELKEEENWWELNGRLKITHEEELFLFVGRVVMAEAGWPRRTEFQMGKEQSMNLEVCGKYEHPDDWDKLRLRLVAG